MSTHAAKTAKSGPQPPPVERPRGRRVLAEDFIDERLSRARRQIRLIDLGTSVMTLLLFTLGFFLTASILDHWIFHFGLLARWVLFATLLLGVIWYAMAAIAPLLLRRINPLHAARTIEEGVPSLKNSLINFLHLRSSRTNLHQLVYHAVETQAATDLSGVPPELAADRSRLIRVGYVFTAILTVAAVYKILSPKDPFQSVMRIAAPWANISRPTRVEIVDVQPGNVTVFHGETVPVQVVIRGGMQARVLYSTTDGKFVDQSIPMELDESGRQHIANLPPEMSGAQQDMLYRIVAGDAQSPRYRIHVSPAPSVTVERLEYSFPEYTQRPPVVTHSTGDIEAPEETHVTIHARANRRIRSANLELQRAPATSAKAGADELLRLPMELDGPEARRTLVLHLDSQREAPLFQSYQIRITDEDGHTNQQPIRYQIRVQRDLPPEVEILSPTSLSVDVPLDRTQQVEVRSLDPDYGLQRVKLVAESGDKRVADRTLLDEPTGWQGQYVGRSEFAPAALGLDVGERVTYWAEAEDNRRNADGEHDPGRSRTRSYQFLVTEPVGGGQPSAASEPDAGNPSREPDAADAPHDPAQPSDDSQQRPADPQESSGEGGEETGSESSEQQPGAESGADPTDGQQSSDGEGSESSGGDSSGGDSSPSETDGVDGGTGKTGSGDTGSADAASQEGSSPSEGTGLENGDAGENGKGPGGSPAPDAGSGSGGESESSEPLHDGEVFERALEHMQDRQRSRAEDASTGGGDNPGDQPTETPSPEASSSESANSGDPDSGGERQDRAKSETRDSTKEDGLDEPSGSEREGAPSPGPDGAATGEPRSPQQPPSQDQPEDPAGGTRADRKGDPGSGQQSNDPQAGSSSDSENRDRQKQPDPGQDPTQRPDTESASGSEQQSDSEGSTGGDQSGGGQEGGGQSADQPGRDHAGGNSPAEEGAGAASEAGDGESGHSPGQQQQSEGQTGSAGDEAGAGSSVRPDTAGDEPGGEGKRPPGQSSAGSDARPADQQPQRGDDDVAGESSSGGGVPTDNPSAKGPQPQGEVAAADEANLEYAKEATDMVLEYLGDQRDHPDKKLLDKLGWTPEELRSFVDRWQQFKNAAKGDVRGEQKLDNSLRGLGLRPPRGRVRQGSTNDRPVDRLRESGAIAPPPAAYQRQFDAFRKSRARISE